MAHISWAPVIARAKEINEEEFRLTGRRPTLRDCWYSLYQEACFTTPKGVVKDDLRTESKRLKKTYDRLSELTAEARRQGTFPDFSDNTRSVEEPPHWDDAEDMRSWVKDIFRIDRTQASPGRSCSGSRSGATLTA